MQTSLNQADSPPLHPLKQGDRPIVFFDGECVMCNGFVNLMLDIDQAGLLRITPLQGETAQHYLPPLPHDPEEWSIYYLDENGLYSQSDAFVEICRRLGGIWSVLAAVGLVQQSIRDAVYRLIARNRYRLFGRRSTCRVASPEEKERFLP